MSFEKAFLELMSTTVTRRAYASRDAYGKPSYSTGASTYQARVVAKPMIVATPAGVVTVADDIMYLATTDAIGEFDQITHNGSTHRIFQIGRETDETGVHHMWIRTKGA